VLGDKRPLRPGTKLHLMSLHLNPLSLNVELHLSGSAIVAL